MSKITLEDLQSILSDMEAAGKITGKVTNEIINDAEKIVEELAEEKANEPKEKKPKAQYVVVASQEQYEQNKLDEVAFYVVKIPENVDHNNLELYFNKAAVNFNENDRKAKKHKIETLPDAFGSLKKKHFLGVVQPEANIPKIITKEPIICVGLPQEIVSK